MTTLIPPYVINNFERTDDLFVRRVAYKNKLRQSNSRHIIDFSLGEKIFYGRMNMDQIAIYPRERYLATLPSKSSDAPKKVFRFVARVFNMMRAEMEGHANIGKIKNNDKYLSRLQVYKAYENSYNNYQFYVDIMSKQLAKTIKKDDKVYQNMKEFLSILLDTFSGAFQEMPMTYSGFLKSKNCSVMNSGLAIEISDLGYSNDQKKITDFVNSPNFSYFVNICGKYGFMIDMNAPWRIVADINSDIMKRSAEMDQNGSGYSILSTYYRGAFKRSLEVLPGLLSNLYEEAVQQQYFVEEFCNNGGITKKIIYAQKYNFSKIVTELGAENLIKLYMHLRFFESRPETTLAQKQKLINDTLRARAGGRPDDHYMGIFESILSKTFDKIGSVDYYVEATRKINQSLFEERRISGIVLGGDSPSTSGGGGGY